jgi:hypothetical protein
MYGKPGALKTREESQRAFSAQLFWPSYSRRSTSGYLRVAASQLQITAQHFLFRPPPSDKLGPVNIAESVGWISSSTSGLEPNAIP